MMSYSEQVSVFNNLRDHIDYVLRATGFEEFATTHGLDAGAGRLVVAREFDYSSELADIDIDLDPLASRLATKHLVGVMAETPGGSSFKGRVVSEAWRGDVQQPAGYGVDLDSIQLVTVWDAVSWLLREKTGGGRLLYLTKSLKKVDPAGD